MFSTLKLETKRTFIFYSRHWAVKQTPWLLRGWEVSIPRRYKFLFLQHLGVSQVLTQRGSASNDLDGDLREMEYLENFKCRKNESQPLAPHFIGCSLLGRCIAFLGFSFLVCKTGVTICEHDIYNDGVLSIGTTQYTSKISCSACLRENTAQCKWLAQHTVSRQAWVSIRTLSLTKSVALAKLLHFPSFYVYPFF